MNKVYIISAITFLLYFANSYAVRAPDGGEEEAVAERNEEAEAERNEEAEAERNEVTRTEPRAAARGEEAQRVTDGGRTILLRRIEDSEILPSIQQQVAQNQMVIERWLPPLPMIQNILFDGHGMAQNQQREAEREAEAQRGGLFEETDPMLREIQRQLGEEGQERGALIPRDGLRNDIFRALEQDERMRILRERRQVIAGIELRPGIVGAHTYLPYLPPGRDDEERQEMIIVRYEREAQMVATQEANQNASQNSEAGIRKNNTLIGQVANAMQKLLEDINKEKNNALIMQKNLKDEIFESVLIQHSIEMLLNEKNSKNSEKKKCYSALDSTLTLYPFLKIMFDEEPEVIVEKASKDDKGLEFLMESVINHDLVPPFYLVFTKQGVETIAEHMKYLKYFILQKVQKENHVSLFDFLFENDDFRSERRRFFREKNFLAFGVVRKESAGEEWPTSFCNIDEYDFAYDVVGHPHSRDSILADLRLDPGNFQGGEIPLNLDDILDRLINKGKHYFLFFHEKFDSLLNYDRHSPCSKVFFQTLSYFLLNDKDPNWKEGFKTRQERMEVASDFLKNCTNNSGRSIVYWETGKQDLGGNQRIPKKKCIESPQNCDCSGKCMINCIDFSKNLHLIDQFKFSLIPAHKKAEKLFSWMFFRKEFIQRLSLTGEELSFRFFWAQSIDWEGISSNVVHGYFSQHFPLFIQAHPDYVMEDYEEKKKACMGVMGIDKEPDFLNKAIPLYCIERSLSMYNTWVEGEGFRSLFTRCKKLLKNVNSQFAQIMKEYPRVESIRSYRTVEFILDENN